MANNQKERREISHVEENCKDNSIFTIWTQTWGLKIRPWYAADKLKFSFIEKGADGKGKSFDICMDTIRSEGPCMDNWAYDILHDRRLEHILAEEKKAGEKYSKYYKFSTGDNAEKSIGITNSTKEGYCICGSIPKDGNKINAFIPITFHGLRQIAEWYIRSYEPRKKELEKMRSAAENNNLSNRDNSSTVQNQKNDNTSKQEPSSTANAQTNNSTSSNAKNETSNTTSSAKQEVKSAEKNNNANNVQQKNDCCFTSKSKLSEMEKYPGSFKLEVIEGKDEKILIFLADQIAQVDQQKWTSFKQLVAKQKTRFQATVCIKNNVYYFQKFALS